MKKTFASMLAGVLLGAALLGGAQAAVETYAVQRSAQKFYVDGERVQMEAYSINGSNYVKLRDVGRLVGFNVTWDAESNSAMIDTGIPYEDDSVTTAQPMTAAPDTGGTVRLPADGSKYVPKASDRILCDDGTIYEIKDVSRWENNVFAPGPLPELPTPTCDWSLFPALELPPLEVRRYSDDAGDDLFVRNLYETRRMQYTLYNAIGSNPASWRDGKPLAEVYLTIPAEYEAYTAVFWPWRSIELEKHIKNDPRGRFRIECWDYYHNGTFLETRYYLCMV